MGEHQSSGILAGGLPFNHIGEGPPVVALQGLTFESRSLSRLDARFMLGPYRPLAKGRSFYVVNRRPGLSRGTTLSEMAGDYAQMMREEFEAPVDVIGISSGGSIAFYLAAEHPDVVRRLVVQDCGCRLTDWGREWGREIRRLAEAGRWRMISELMMRTIWPDNTLGHAIARLFSPLMALSAPDDATDMIALLEAEDGHDFTSRLGEITAPALVACGELDPFAGAALARETADGMPHGQAVVYEGVRHGLRGQDFGRDLVDFLAGEAVG